MSSDSEPEREDKFELNPNATPFVPKTRNNPNIGSSKINASDQKENTEENKEEVEIPIDALEEFQEDLLNRLMKEQPYYMEKFKDCSCCKGYVYNCQGEICKYLEVCHCKAKVDIEKTHSQ